MFKIYVPDVNIYPANINRKLMKKLFFILFSLVFSYSAIGQNKGIGAGIIIGEPTGLSAKLWTSSSTAVDAAAAWSFRDNGYLHLHADFLFHSFAIDVSEGQLPLYFGLGARFLIGNESAIGIRIPLGIAYHFATEPFEIFMEIAPIMNLVPATEFDMNGAIGVRYYF